MSSFDLDISIKSLSLSNSPVDSESEEGEDNVVIMEDNLSDTYSDYYELEHEEYLNILENAGLLIYELLSNEPNIYIQPNAHDIIINEVSDLLHHQMAEIIDEGIDIEHIIEDALELFYKHIAPPRSFPKTFIRAKQNKEKLKQKIEYLLGVPQPEQRTDDWYNFRYKYLTASNIYKTFISDATRNQLIYEKCQPINPNKFKTTNTESTLHWGHKYEPLSISIYEEKYKTKVGEFGCIPHRHYGFLAASPDGINILESSDRYGRMVEVKNIVNREIDGIPKLEYWVQMQFQMEVCDLNECDFIETRFIEYDDQSSFEKDISSSKKYNLTHDNKIKGIIMQFAKLGEPHYVYAPNELIKSKDQFELWEQSIMEDLESQGYSWIKNIYWKLDQFSCVLVLRNKFWFNNVIHMVEDLWNIIEKERQEGYHHRAPMKRPTKVIKLENDNTNNSIYKPLKHSNTCFININTMENDNNIVLENSANNNELNNNEVNNEVNNEEIKMISINTEVFTSSFDVLSCLDIHKS